MTIERQISPMVFRRWHYEYNYGAIRRGTEEERERATALTSDNKTIKSVVKKTPSAPAVGSCNKRARKTPRWMWRVIIPTKWTRPIPNLGESRQVLLHVPTPRHIL